MRYFKLIILLSILSCNNQTTLNTDKLAIELDSIMEADQKYRSQMKELSFNSPEFGQLWMKQSEIDKSNVSRIIEIINQINGYPGKSLVGESASKTTFYVLQHAPDSIQEQYYPLIMDAASNNELDKRLAAMYQDRYLMRRGEHQIFGTQIRSEYQTDSITGERREITFVWPISDTTNIDSLRLVNGMEPLEEYLNNFGISRWN